jgi:hypothetical protein
MKLNLCFFLGVIKQRDTFNYFHMCRHFLDRSAAGGKSLQLNVHAFVRNFDNFGLMSETTTVCIILLD